MMILYICRTPVAKSRDLAAKCGIHFASASGIPTFNPVIAEQEHGKPYFSACPEICFSTSHSGQYWACAVTDDGPVGLDIQQIRPARQQAIVTRHFAPEEIAFWRRGGNFFDLWCSKESYTKYCGKGLSMGLASFSTVYGGSICGHALGCTFTLFRFAEGYHACLCTRGETRFSTEWVQPDGRPE